MSGKRNKRKIGQGMKPRVKPVESSEPLPRETVEATLPSTGEEQPSTPNEAPERLLMQPENGGTEKTETADEPEAENQPASVAKGAIIDEAVDILRPRLNVMSDEEERDFLQKLEEAGTSDLDELMRRSIEVAEEGEHDDTEMEAGMGLERIKELFQPPPIPDEIRAAIGHHNKQVEAMTGAAPIPADINEAMKGVDAVVAIGPASGGRKLATGVSALELRERPLQTLEPAKPKLPTIAELEEAIHRGELAGIQPDGQPVYKLGEQPDGTFKMVISVPEGYIEGIKSQAESDNCTPEEWMSIRVGEYVSQWFFGK